MIYIMGIDIGTTNIKVLLLDASNGGTACGRSMSYEIDTPRTGYAEYSPEKWYSHCCNCIQSLIKENNIEPEDIKAVGVSGQMHGLVALDEGGKPVHPAILHCDARSSAQLGEIKSRVGGDIIRRELMNPLYTGFLLPSLCWLRTEKPEVYARIRHVLLPKDYINLRLTGKLCTDYSDASATLAFDVKNCRWSEKALSKLGIDIGLFPCVKNSADVIGAVTSEAAELTGLCEGTAVACGGGDAVMQALGNGLTDGGYGIINIGTSGQVLFASSSATVNPRRSTNIFCGVQKQRWVLMGAIMSAGAAYKWAADLLSEQDYGEFDRGINKVPPGSGGLLFLPHLNGERTPYLSPTLRGALLGASLASGKSEVGRAVMEGISFSLLLCYDECRRLGLDAESFIVSGGGAKSKVWVQMLADIFGKPLRVTEMEEQAAVGAAMCAGIGAGIYSDIGDAVKRVVKISSKKYCPHPYEHGRYMKYYELFKKAYEANKEVLRLLYSEAAED